MSEATPIGSIAARRDQSTPSQAENAARSRPASMLAQPYVIALNIPLYDWNGVLHTDHLWLLDLRRHLDYIASLTLFCPVIKAPPPPGCEPLPKEAPYDRLRVAGVKPGDSMLAALALAPLHLLQAWRAVKKADIVHGGGVGWPIPLGYFCAFAAKLQGKFHISVMESSTWRLLPNEPASLPKRLRADFMEYMARRIARQSDLALFTTNAYRDSMVGPGAANGHVFKASWIPEQQLRPLDAVSQRWAERESDPVLRIGFAARLTVDKGTRVLLDAVRHLAPEHRYEVAILGEGPCAADIAALRPPAHVTVKHLGTVEYGDPFFGVLDQWDVVVVPSLSDEQPRIVYDTFARGLPVVGSRTSALAECIADGTSGVLFDVGDSRSLAACLSALAADRGKLARMGVTARSIAEAHTHAKMHAERRVLIDQAWARTMR